VLEPLILAHDLGYSQTESLMDTLEEASRLLNGYARAILASGSLLLASISEGYQGEALPSYFLAQK